MVWLFVQIKEFLNLLNGKESTYTWSKDDFYLVDKPIEKRNVGYPLDSISVIPENGKYFAELVEQKDEKYKKKESIEKVINFIVESLIS